MFFSSFLKNKYLLNGQFTTNFEEKKSGGEKTFNRFVYAEISQKELNDLVRELINIIKGIVRIAAIKTWYKKYVNTRR